MPRGRIGVSLVGLVALVALAGTVVARRADTGLIVSTVLLDQLPVGMVVDGQSRRAFVVGDNGHVSVLDTRSGALLRTVQVGYGPLVIGPQAWAVDEQTGRVFIANQDTSVSTLDATSGRLLRNATVDVNASAMAVAERAGRVFIAAWGSGSGGSVSVLDARSGGLLRTVTVGGSPEEVVVDERSGRVFVAAYDAGTPGSLSVLDARSGAVLRTVQVGWNPNLIAMDARHGRIFVVNRGPLDSNGTPIGPGSVSELDAHSGRVVRTIALTLSPRAVAVDEWTGHVFIGGDNVVRATDPWSWAPGWLRRRLPFLRGSGTRTMPGSMSLLEVSR